MSNNITIKKPQNFLTDETKLESAWRLATAFWKSGTFNQTIANTEQALTVLIAGNEAGLQPIESMNAFYMVKGSLVMYGSALSKVISRAGVEIKFLERSKTKIKIEYSKNDKVIDTLEYSISELPPTSKAKNFAPEEKLVYHAHSRFLRYNDVGVSIPYTDYDEEVIETKNELADKKNILEKLKLEKTKAVFEDKEDSKNAVLKEIEDGALLEAETPTTKV
jgi:hypothetical protein